MLGEPLQSIIVSLKEKTNDTHLLAKLSMLPPEELSQLYNWLFLAQLAEANNHYFKDFFKKNEKQIYLVYFLSHTLIENPELHNELLTYLNDHNLLLLLEHLLKVSKTNSAFIGPLNQALLNFCNRLYANPTEGWTKHPYSKELVFYLLHNPECIFNLSQTHSTLYAWTTWSSYSLALKYRIDAVLNYAELSPDELKQCALIWLEYYQETPQHLYTIFSNLNLSEDNRNIFGKKNLQNLKITIWSLLCPNRFYVEKEFLTLFTPGNELLKTIPTLITLYNNQVSLYQQSLWLAKTKTEIPKDYSVAQLIAQLTNSVQANNLVNWEKTRVWLEKQNLSTQRSFLKDLITANANIPFNQRTYTLLTQCSQVTAHSSKFDEKEFAWLILNSYAKEQGSWFAQMKQNHDAGTFNIGLFFCYLPDEPFLLKEILDHELFSNAKVLAALFAQLHLQDEKPHHLSCLIPLIKNKDYLWLRHFINEFISSISNIKNHLMVLFILNNLILSPETALSADKIHDKKIIADYFKLLDSLIKLHPSETHLTELIQLIFNPLSVLIPQDEHWANFIFTDPAFNSLFVYLVSIGTTLNNNPLMPLFLNPAFVLLDATTITAVQNYVHDLLVQAPKSLQAQQFSLLFNCLLPENKLRLTRTILASSTENEVHQQVLHQLSALLPLTELLPHFNKKKKNYLFKEIASHPDAGRELSAIQWYSLFTGLSAAEFSEPLRNEHLSLTTRGTYVQAFFKAYQRNPQLLDIQLQQWGLSEEQILLLANFVIEESDHLLLQQILAKKKHPLQLNSEQLTQIKFNKNSYLHKQTQKAIIDGSLHINVSLLKQLPPEDIYAVLQQQTQEAAKIQTLANFFSPFDTDKTKVLPLLHSARWLHQLPLIHSGMLEIVQFYQQRLKRNELTIINAIKQTTLFQKAIAPLLAGTPLTLNSLFEDLQSYCQAMAAQATEHVAQINKSMLVYEKNVETLKAYSSPQLHAPFKPNAQQVSIDEENLFLRAAATQQEWTKRKNIDLELFFINSLHSFINQANLTEESAYWLLQQLHFTSLNTNLEELNLDKFLTQLSPVQLASYLTQIYKQLEHYQKCWELFPNINSREALFSQLFVIELDVLNQLMASCTTLNLTFLKEFIALHCAIKKLGLSQEQSTQLFLDTARNEQQEMRWLLLDLHNMKRRLNHAERNLNQLYLYGFNYQRDNKENHERLQTLAAPEKAIPLASLAQILNSYVPEFTKTEAIFFLHRVEECLKKSPQELLKNLDEKTILLLINTALLEVNAHIPLLEQILLSEHSKQCQQLLQLKLNADYSGRRQNEPEGLSLQRLLYFAKPNHELESFIVQDSSQYSKRLFCSLTSFYQNLNTATPATAEVSSWLMNYGQVSRNDYWATMTEWETSEEPKDPATFFNWLCWKNALFSTIYNDRENLAKSFINWLSQEKKPANNSYLTKLIDYAAKEKQLKTLLAYTTQYQDILSAEQKLWLCEHSLPHLHDEPDSLALIIELNSCTTLSALLSKTMNLALLKTALEKADYWQGFTNDKEELIKQLCDYKLSTAQLLELIQCAANPSIKTQLILFFLSQANNLAMLQGQSMLEHLNQNKAHQPSRLNGLVQQIAPQLLSKEQITHLLPEAALSLLCCIAHFPLFSQEQIQLLVTKLEQPKIWLYWLTHYAAMPNGFYMLAHFTKLARNAIYVEIKKLDAPTQQWFIQSMLEHLELFEPSNQLLQETEQEEHLTLALNQYLHGHNHPNYVSFIQQITERLLKKNHIFSLAATSLLIRLQGDPQFTELNQSTAYLVNYQLKTHAQSGSLALFYDAAYPNIGSMTQLIPVKPKYPETEKTGGFLASLLNPFFARGTAPENLTTNTNPLIDTLAEVAPRIKAFDYFLIHYQGNLDNLQALLNHYLNFYAQKTEPDFRKALYHSSTLMTRQELTPKLRDTIYQAFLNYPKLYDEHISYCLFLVNAEKTIQYIGLKGSVEHYKQVIDLCTLAQKKLDPSRHPDIITTAKTALFEAKIELAFAEDKGFFSRLFRRFKRCWAYGWTGFFTPNKPSYVRPIDEAKPAENTMEQAQHAESAPCTPPTLLTLVNELQKEYSMTKLDKLILALNKWEQQKNKAEERSIRQELDHLFHRLLIDSVKNTDLATWLSQNQAALIMSRFHLLELYLVNKEHEPALRLLKQSNQDSPYFHYLIPELNSSMPKLMEPPLSHEGPSTPPEPTGANSTWNWVSAFSFFGNSATTVKAPEIVPSITPNPQ